MKEEITDESARPRTTRRAYEKNKWRWMVVTMVAVVGTADLTSG